MRCYQTLALPKQSYSRSMFSDTSSFSQEPPARRENGCRQSNNNALFSFANPHHSSPKAQHAPISRRDYSKNWKEIKENRELFVIFPHVFPANARLVLPFYPIPTTSVALSKCHSPFCVRWSVIHIPLNADKAIILLFGIRGNALFNPDATNSSAKSSYLCQ